VAAVAIALGADYLVVRLMLSRTGGIRPPSRALAVGAAAGAVTLQLLRVPMGLILELAVDKPQYGALTVPISLLLVLYLNSTILYAAAALTAGVAEREVPLDEILPVSTVAGP
jgi:membrane protein